MFKKLPIGARIMSGIALLLFIPAVISDYSTVIPKMTSIFLAALGSITMLVIWFKYGKIKKE